MNVESAEFAYIKEITNATSGNISVQLDKLQKAGYIEIKKTFKGKMPCTICNITDKGKSAFEEYVESIKSYIVVSNNH